MIDVSYLIMVSLIATIPIPVFWYVFRFRLRTMLLGAVAIILAVIVEIGYEKAMKGQNLLLMVVFIAPIIEETIKMIMTWFGKNVKTGVGIGLGFAVIENTLYYLSYPFMLPQLIMLREFSDPLLHSTGAGVSSGAWKKPWKYFIAISLHSLYNIVALTNSVLYISVLSTGYLGILLFLKWKDGSGKFQKENHGTNKDMISDLKKGKIEV